MSKNRNGRLVLLTSIGLLVVGCSHLVGHQQTTVPVGSVAAEEESVQKPPSAPNEHGSPGPVIGHLETRGKRITIHGGKDEGYYTVKSLDGKVLAENLSGSELLSNFPYLHRIVENASAGNDASLGPGGQQRFGVDKVDRIKLPASRTKVIENNKPLENIAP